MSIEDYNRQITRCKGFKLERNETIRGGRNEALIASLRQVWREIGFASESDYTRSNWSRQIREIIINSK